MCECGSVKQVLTSKLTSLETKSCGCLRQENRTKHGLYKTPMYRIWDGIKQRCYNPNSNNYHLYGGRGIKMCETWINNPEKFISEIGERPSKKHSLDRINVNGDYVLGNLRWATQREQGRNMRKNRLLLNLQTGIFYTSAIEAAEAHNIKESTLEYNIKHAKTNKTNLILL